MANDPAPQTARQAIERPVVLPVWEAYRQPRNGCLDGIVCEIGTVALGIK